MRKWCRPITITSLGQKPQTKEKRVIHSHKRKVTTDNRTISETKPWRHVMTNHGLVFYKTRNPWVSLPLSLFLSLLSVRAFWHWFAAISASLSPPSTSIWVWNFVSFSFSFSKIHSLWSLKRLLFDNFSGGRWIWEWSLPLKFQFPCIWIRKSLLGLKELPEILHLFWCPFEKWSLGFNLCSYCSYMCFSLDLSRELVSLLSMEPVLEIRSNL